MDGLTALRGRDRIRLLSFSHADVAELADALDLGSSAARRMGSTPFIRTILIIERAVRCAFTAACAVSLPRLNEGGFVV